MGQRVGCAGCRAVMGGRAIRWLWELSLRCQPASAENTEITVCGDTHGQFYDLCNIFGMNGIPVSERSHSIEASRRLCCRCYHHFSPFVRARVWARVLLQLLLFSSNRCTFCDLLSSLQRIRMCSTETLSTAARSPSKSYLPFSLSRWGPSRPPQLVSNTPSFMFADGSLSRLCTLNMCTCREATTRPRT